MAIEKIYKKKDIYEDLDTLKSFKDLSEFIKCNTTSYIDQSKMDWNEFKKIHEYVTKNFPNIEKYGVKTPINGGSIYYYIEGENKELPALLLMGHLDVVPPIKEELWEYPPFSGEITEDYIYGRGAMDMKHIDCAIAEAIEYSLSHNGKPNRSIYLCYGHDEETLGYTGQWEVKNDLKKKNANIGMVIDEGGRFSDGSKYSAKCNMMEIQVMEKGYLDVKITGKSAGGHSSNPGNHTALGNVCHAIAKIEDNQFSAHLNGPMINFYKSIYNYIVDEELKKLVANIDNDSDSVANYLLNDNKLQPIVRTTIAATMIESDSKGANVLPQEVNALINLRLSSFDTVESAMSYLKDLCKDIPVELTCTNGLNASAISNIESKEFNFLKEMIFDYFDVEAVVPNISVGGTDCCFYNEICDNCFRFSPIICDEELGKGVHGVNEHVSKKAYIYGIKFYIEMIEKYCYNN